ncbi:hypothetical protein DYBT9623_00246 [Dyadobacter sp. CECT 9623]|uniref:DUF4174 domain-containing protein n=1 Tax=Dyadobacter linearis TaxID=2823330 RepID=A0ABM8UJB8_9BACT|nr:DUF4174 domain-containing protein [Dyadobacter sp. CECT 9623]CAG5067525.1 hypothetical protein DYBT9623_00246 [Dyadobacter sp. CECT 9623]
MKTLFVLLFMTMSIADEPRKVLLFYKANGAQQLKSQLSIFEAAKKGMQERDINVESIPFSTQNADQWKKWKVDTNEAFTFILVGRDGGEKHRSDEAVPTEKLFGLIDAMPMRKREINN